jgi:hypothetical protein
LMKPMGMSKRQRERRAEEIRQWQESERLRPLPPREPWTTHELEQLDKIETLLGKLAYGESHDIDSLSELLRCSGVFPRSSLRIDDLSRRVPHYRKLSQEAAKAKLWEKMRTNFSGLQTELRHLRDSRLRGGVGAQ